MKFYLGPDPRAPCSSSRCKPTILLSWTALGQEAETLWPFNSCQGTNVMTTATHWASPMELQATPSPSSKASPNNTSTLQRAGRQARLAIADNTLPNKRQTGQGTWKTLWAQTNKPYRHSSYLANLHVKHLIPLFTPLLLH